MSLHWNYAAALDRVGSDEALLRELIDIFFEEYPKYVNRLNEAVSRQDPLSLREAAHALKGSLGYLGATAAEKMAIEIEGASLAGDPVTAAGLVTEFASRDRSPAADHEFPAGRNES